ncbi:MAG: two-component system sensor histidine kinase/response regulator [Gammaproteobacteria bacterium]|jgi:two-component system sensor histidine kinase/response regulator
MSKKPIESEVIQKSIISTDNPIDPQSLTNMFGDNPELFKEILNDFIVPTWDIINEIKTGWENRSAEEIEMAAHKLKSSAKSVGAIELGDICSILEVAGKKQDWATIDPLIPKLEPIMYEIEQYIKTL